MARGFCLAFLLVAALCCATADAVSSRKMQLGVAAHSRRSLLQAAPAADSVVEGLVAGELVSSAVGLLTLNSSAMINEAIHDAALLDNNATAGARRRLLRNDDDNDNDDVVVERSASNLDYSADIAETVGWTPSAPAAFALPLTLTNCKNALDMGAVKVQMAGPYTWTAGAGSYVRASLPSRMILTVWARDADNSHQITLAKSTELGDLCDGHGCKYSYTRTRYTFSTALIGENEKVVGGRPGDDQVRRDHCHQALPGTQRLPRELHRLQCHRHVHGLRQGVHPHRGRRLRAADGSAGGVPCELHRLQRHGHVHGLRHGLHPHRSRRLRADCSADACPLNCSTCDAAGKCMAARPAPPDRRPVLPLRLRVRVVHVGDGLQRVRQWAVLVAAGLRVGLPGRRFPQQLGHLQWRQRQHQLPVRRVHQALHDLQGPVLSRDDHQGHLHQV